MENNEEEEEWNCYRRHWRQHQLKEFSEVWQAATTFDDICKKYSNRTPASLQCLASRLRRNNVELKYFKRGALGADFESLRRTLPPPSGDPKIT